MECCPICTLQYKGNCNYNHSLTNKHLAAKNHYYCHKCKRRGILADKMSHLHFIEHKNFRKFFAVRRVKRIHILLLNLPIINPKHI